MRRRYSPVVTGRTLALNKVARALTWSRAVAQSEPDELDNHYAAAPMACLRSLLDDSYLGGA
jgi:hypothetical protein